MMATYVLAPHDLEEQRPDADTATVGRAFDASRGSEILEQRIVRYAPGRSRPVETGDRIAVLYVAEGRGEIHVAGTALHSFNARGGGPTRVAQHAQRVGQ